MTSGKEPEMVPDHWYNVFNKMKQIQREQEKDKFQSLCEFHSTFSIMYSMIFESYNNLICNFESKSNWLSLLGFAQHTGWPTV